MTQKCSTAAPEREAPVRDLSRVSVRTLFAEVRRLRFELVPADAFERTVRELERRMACD
jgi:hypothetical protein